MRQQCPNHNHHHHHRTRQWPCEAAQGSPALGFERLAVAMEVAALHHSAQRVEVPREGEVLEEKRKEEELAKEMERAQAQEDKRLQKLSNKVRADMPLTSEEDAAWRRWVGLPPAFSSSSEKRSSKKKKRRKKKLAKLRAPPSSCPPRLQGQTWQHPRLILLLHPHEHVRLRHCCFQPLWYNDT